MDIAAKYPTSTSPKSGEPAPFASQVGASEVSYLNNVSIEEEGERCMQGMFDSVYGNKLRVGTSDVSYLHRRGR